MAKRMRIAYTTIYDASSTERGFGSYNASAYYLARALSRAGAECDLIGPLKETFAPIYVAKQMYHRKFTGKTYNRHREVLAAKDFSRQIAALVRNQSHDIVFSPISPGSQPVAYAECKQPIVICSDSPLACAVENYPALSWEAAVRSNLQSGLENERAALTRAALVFYPSSWAANFACRHYGLTPGKVRVVPWGANLESDRSGSDIERMICDRSMQTLHLLFIGMDWERKGGPTVVATAEELRNRGIPVHLDIVGCNPFGSNQPVPEFITVHGRLVRNDPAQLARFNDLLQRSHFLMMPSRGEAFGHVFAEASSFGVPSIGTDIDGIPAAIRDGRNGKLFAFDETPTCYADAIAQLFSNTDSYRKLARSSFREYTQRLNWDVAARSMLQIIDEVVLHRRTPNYAPKAA